VALNSGKVKVCAQSKLTQQTELAVIRMQPCLVCGGGDVDAAGYCTQCRTCRHPSGQHVGGAGGGRGR
jgi:hypothetical protein